MALTLIATPIGNPKDWTLRSIEALKNAELVIVEEYRAGSTLLKSIGITGKDLENLNEHSDKERIHELFEFCKSKNVCLITDCGTPSFSDPGYQLVKLCRQNNIKVTSLPGPSSLMTLISLSSEKLSNFVFIGFLPAEKTARQQALQNLKTEKRAMIIMDTPYRLNKLLQELAETLPQRKALLALNMTKENELYTEDTLIHLHKKTEKQKSEFMLLIYKNSSKN